MNFEEVLRQKIAETPSKVGKGILKVVLGEFQQKNSSGKATPADAYVIIEKVIAGNKETLGFLKADDPRRAALEEENTTVSALLPPYLSGDEVVAKINGDAALLAQVNDMLAKCDRSKPVSDVANAAHIGRATGVVIKAIKSQKLEVKGEAVKEALSKLFTA